MKKVSFFIVLVILSIISYSQTHWEKYPGNPVMVPGNEGEWIYNAMGPSTVMLIDSTYHMYYHGHGSTNSRYWAIGHATSPDGITWTKDSNNPILELGTSGDWDGYWISDAFVLKSDNIFHMWYSGRRKGSQFRIFTFSCFRDVFF